MQHVGTESDDWGRIMSAKVRTCLWFERGGMEAARLYTSLLPESHLETPDDGGKTPLVVQFTLAGAPFMILNGGPHYKLSPAASIMVSTRDQAETDLLWDALLADGGQESRCGWLVDRFGVSWQIVPQALQRFLSDPDREAAGRAQQAMLQMNKIVIADLEKAFRSN